MNERVGKFIQGRDGSQVIDDSFSLSNTKKTLLIVNEVDSPFSIVFAICMAAHTLAPDDIPQ